MLKYFPGGAYPQTPLVSEHCIRHSWQKKKHLKYYYSLCPPLTLKLSRLPPPLDEIPN